ncbi:DDIT3 protein, partial [Psilopogon haemacephalus]|nr:DDIT3 protein [Psilopogon haemacephalus]
MAAEELPVEDPSWELEAWYQDLQEVLAAAEPGEPSLAWGGEQVKLPAAGPQSCQLDTSLAAELLELLGPEGTTSTQPAGTTCPAQLGTEEEEEEEEQQQHQHHPGTATALPKGLKRKRRSSWDGAKRREQASEQLLLELRAHNQRLREEIGRLSAEVAQTRAALIDHIVNLRRA